MKDDYKYVTFEQADRDYLSFHTDNPVTEVLDIEASDAAVA